MKHHLNKAQTINVFETILVAIDEHSPTIEKLILAMKVGGTNPSNVASTLLALGPFVETHHETMTTRIRPDLAQVSRRELAHRVFRELLKIVAQVEHSRALPHQ